MKKLFKLGFVAIFAAVMILSGCTDDSNGTGNSDIEQNPPQDTQNTPHEHTFATEWSSSDTYHWHAATCEHTDEIKDGAEHTWNAGKVTKKATEEADGEILYDCIICNKTKIETIPAIGHSHTIATTWSNDDTYHWHAASCGEETHNTDKAEHSWYNGVVTKKASCTETGEMTYTCTVCDKIKTQTISATGHSYSKVWSENTTHHWHECSCGAKSDEAEHAWNAVVTTPPTTETAGIKTLKCTVCGATETQSIPKITLLDNKWINVTECQKTEEVVVCQSSVTIAMTDDSSWSEHVAGTDSDFYKGVYIKDRTVTLSPFVMGKYEVTQELFEAVMGTNPSESKADSTTCVIADGENPKLRPVEFVNWYHAIAFCNKLSIIEGLEPCYTVEGVNDWANLEYSSIPIKQSDPQYEKWEKATCDLKKKGYRLPTEAEWEFAARGGNANAAEWKYAFSGVNVAGENKIYDGSTALVADANLENYAWYKSNAGDNLGSGNKGYGTHEVGTKLPNSLGLYDMSGNVMEWCWDWLWTISTGEVTDPTGDSREKASGAVLRGGSWYLDAYRCAVFYRYFSQPQAGLGHLGFRIARSL